MEHMYNSVQSKISETCDKENSVQLITRVSVEVNTTDDQELLKNDIENIKGRMDIEELTTDGGYVGEKADKACNENNVTHKVTDVKGNHKEGSTLNLDDFEMGKNCNGVIDCLTCPNRNVAVVKAGRKNVRTLRVSDRQFAVSEKRKQVADMSTEERNIRASVMAMDGSEKELCPFLPYVLQDLWEIGSDPESIITLKKL